MDLYLLTLLVIVTDAFCIFMLYEVSRHGTIGDVCLWAACITGLSAVLGILLACIVLNIGG